jgi:hypothetical protein
MVEISILVGFSPFFIQVGVFLILVPTIEFGFWFQVMALLDFGFVHRKFIFLACTLCII